MRGIISSSVALTVVASSPASAKLSYREFASLMSAAVLASAKPAELQPLNSIICIQRKLEPPLASIKAWQKVADGTGKVWRPFPIGDVGADKSLMVALSPQADVPEQSSMPVMPKRFIMMDGAAPPECVIPLVGGRGPNWRHDEAIVNLTFTQPAFANGYAYIEENKTCAGLCGTRYLRVFQKQRNKWVQVGRTILSVS
jgi:hypothetical protein